VDSELIPASFDGLEDEFIGESRPAGDDAMILI
jgi:hypothetical protein